MQKSVRVYKLSEISAVLGQLKAIRPSASKQCKRIINPFCTAPTGT